MEGSFRREQHINTGEESARGGAREGIDPIQTSTFLLLRVHYPRSFGSGKDLSSTVTRSSALLGTGCTQTGPCRGP